MNNSYNPYPSIKKHPNYAGKHYCDNCGLLRECVESEWGLTFCKACAKETGDY